MHVRWTLTRMAEPERVSESQCTLELISPSGQHMPVTWSISGNVVDILFCGRHQIAVGSYSLRLTVSRKGASVSTSTLRDFVTLTRGETGVSTSDIEVSTDLAIPRNGFSNYELWLMQGNVGSIEDFFEDLMRPLHERLEAEISKIKEQLNTSHNE